MQESAEPRRRTQPLSESTASTEGVDQQWLSAWEQYGGSKRRILEVASHLIAERGFVGTSLKDIALAAGMTPGNVYNHFESKEEILFQGIFAAGEMLWATLTGAMREVETPEDRLLSAIRIFLSYTLTPAPWLSVGQELRWITDNPRRDILHGHRDRLEHFFRELVSRYTGRDVEDAEVFLGTAALLAFITSTRRWYRPSGRLSIDEIARYVLRMTDASRCSIHPSHIEGAK